MATLIWTAYSYVLMKFLMYHYLCCNNAAYVSIAQVINSNWANIIKLYESCLQGKLMLGALYTVTWGRNKMEERFHHIVSTKC